MAIVVESVASEGSFTLANPCTVTITKPTGLAVGDLLVAVIFNSSSTACDTPSGWTVIRKTNGTTRNIDTFYIVATSTETAASNFTFVATGSGSSRMSGGLLRISGFAASTPVATSNGDATGITNDSTPSYPITVTPSYAESLLIFANFTFSASGNDVSTSAQAITTSNPSWTEAFDLFGGFIIGGAVAYATRTEITATGNATCTLSKGDDSEDSIAQMIVINPIQNATAAVSALSITSALPAVTTQVGINITASPLTVTSELKAPTPEMLSEVRNQSKSSSSWTNETKST